MADIDYDSFLQHLVYYDQPNTLRTGENLLEDTSVSLDYCQNLCENELGCIAAQYESATGICHVKGQCLSMTTQQDTTLYVKKGMV